MPDKTSVLLVDDHTLVRRGFRRILEDEPDITVTGEAGDGAEAIKLADELHPKVIVMDCAMPGMNGLEATRRILQKHPQALVLMLSMHPEETLVRQALEAGARGYVLKNAVDLELGAAIRRVANGETVIDSQLKRPAALRGRRHAGQMCIRDRNKGASPDAALRTAKLSLLRSKEFHNSFYWAPFQLYARLD